MTGAGAAARAGRIGTPNGEACREALKIVQTATIYVGVEYIGE